MSAAQRRKGNVAEVAVARWLRANGWPEARTTRDARGGSQGGADITGVPGWAIEVKSVAQPMIATWWDQTCRQADDAEAKPLLVWHQPGVADPGGWVAIWRGEDDAYSTARGRPPTGRELAGLTILDRPVCVDLDTMYPEVAGSLETWRWFT